MGWLDRSPYRFGTPFAQDLGPIDPRTGLPVAQPTQQNPYAPPAAPRAPTAQQRTQQPNFGQPYQMGAQPMMPVPDFQMGYIDPSMAAYANQGGGLFDLASSNPADVSMKAYQPQPGDQATGSGQDKSQYALNGMLGNINDSDLLTLGLSMLGQSQNGGDWGAVGKDLQGLQQNAMSREDRSREIKRQEEADKRTAELYGYQIDELKAGQAERDYATKNRDRLVVAQKNFVDTATDPSIKAAVEAMDPKEFGAFLGNRILRQEDKAAEVAAAETQRNFVAGENAKDRAARVAQAKLEAELNPRRDQRDTIQFRLDANRIQPWATAADTFTTLTKGRLTRMKNILTDLAQRGGVNGPIPADWRVVASRISGSSQEVQALIEEYKNLAAGLTREEVEKLKPASNMDYDSTYKTLPNIDNNPAASMNMIDRMLREGEAGTKMAQDMAVWLDTNNSLSAPDAQGRTFRDVHGSDPGSSLAPKQESWSSLPPVTDFKEGETIVDDKGQRMMRQGNQWIPVGQSSAAGKPASLPRTSAAPVFVR